LWIVIKLAYREEYRRKGNVVLRPLGGTPVALNSLFGSSYSFRGAGFYEQGNLVSRYYSGAYSFRFLDVPQIL
jgi:hypothetical protein